MKTYLISLMLLSVFLPQQEKMLTKTGNVTFEASVPAFEEVKGTSQTVTCVLNPKTGDIQSQILMKSFRFKIALMEEHFNENYIESDKYPKATFRGRIDKFDAAALTATAKDYTIQGTMEMHGKTKDISMPAKIRKTEAGIEVVSNFTLNVDDYGISIPSVVKSKVSKKVNVHSEFLLK
ncbi:MAG: YceI family protein [Flavobacterium sp.]|nr:MAG: YceI family protein [Flavobacterium sp.]